MNLRLGCHNFRCLSEVKDCRILTEAEERCLSEHRAQCKTCAAEEKQFSAALNMLRNSAFDAEPSAGFDDRLIRRVKVQQARGNVRYWSPMFMGATVAGLLVLAALQVVSTSSELPTFRFGGRNPEVRNTNGASSLPNFEFAPRMKQ